jgi:hypothetical protein
MSMRHAIAAAVLSTVLSLASGWTQACLFATKTPPEGWYEWASALFAGDVSAVEKDVVTVRVVETFKGPDASSGTLTVRLSERYWRNCRVERPESGARVLVAMNANSDAMLVPLSASDAEKLRQLRVKQPRP